jgi:alpha-ketoglutarate-dependent taurine dioxygenase
MAIRCQPCPVVLGAEVEGVDLRQVPDQCRHQWQVGDAVLWDN